MSLRAANTRDMGQHYLGVMTVDDHTTILKRCGKCGAEKSLSEFHNDKKCKYGKAASCKACVKAYGVKYREINSEKCRENKRQYYEDNKEQCLKRTTEYQKAHPEQKRKSGREYYHRNKDKQRLYDIEHKEARSAYKTKWAKENPDKVKASRERRADVIKERNKKYNEAHRKEAVERAARWKRTHPEKAKANEHRREARKRNNGGCFTAEEWKILCEKYNNACLCCGRDDVKLTADHVVPVSKGGLSSIDNIQPLCASCNSKKHDKIIDFRPS